MTPRKYRKALLLLSAILLTSTQMPIVSRADDATTATPAIASQSATAPAVTPATGTTVQPAPTSAPLALLSESPITSGATLRTYQWTSTRNGKPIHVDVHAIVVDLLNPNVKLDVMTGVNGQFTKRQSVRGMAQQTGAVAGTNGDFFNTQGEGVPIGPEVANSVLQSTPPLYSPGYYGFAITKDNKPVIDTFSFQGTVQAKDGATYPLSGINKEYYWFESADPAINGRHSHIDSMYIYTDTWGQTDRANDRDTDLTEVLVTNGIIQQISRYQKIDMIPPKGSYILRTEGAAAQFVLAHMKVGDPLTYTYKVTPGTPNPGYDPAQFKMLIGGQTILVDGGQAAAFSRTDSDVSGYRSRTAVGYSKDQRYVYVVTADNASGSDGLSLPELQQVLVQMGVYKATNLDGGGSTQMVARPLGDTSVQLVNQTENGNERQVVNGLGVFSLAPQGTTSGFLVQGDTIALVGEPVPFSVKAYDQYYNPIVVDPKQLTWAAPAGAGTFNQNVYTPAVKGKQSLTVTSGSAKQTFNLNVIGRDDIASMAIQPSSSVLMANTDITLQVKVQTKDGQTKLVPASAFQWESYGFMGELQGDTLHVKAVQPGTVGQLIARYDGFSTTLALPIGESRLWADFDQKDPGTTSFIGTTGVTGTVSRISGIAGTTGNTLYMGYNMTQGTGTKAAYIQFGANGIPLDGEPQSLTMNVNGDNSLNWLRAQLTDADGKLYYVDLAKSVNWTGWKKVSGDIATLAPKYPVTLKRIYLANVLQGQDERSPIGSIALDDISLLYKSAIPQPPRNQVKITIDKTSYTVNGKPLTMDQAPVIVNDNTLVPVRFLTEALGGQVDWNNDERKVTIRYGTKLIDLWVGQPDLIANGTRVTPEVAPQLMNGRTMVPLRVLSESLGWKVTWDNDTRSVILE